MPCEVVPLRVDFSNLAAVAMKMAKMLKKMKNTKMIIADYSRCGCDRKHYCKKFWGLEGI
jgi:hypothetical protein